MYIFRSERDPERHYVGVTADVDERLAWHNGGPSAVTIPYRPWRVVVQIEFGDERTAVRFEQYLKSGSDRAFARRHFSPER
ncbi:MAG TPA: GIY-YIG nuclease family protein [Vicinamibacterales bacterium]|nr:GIY-YIG nuclease family protein [Vicinamibacterales bacterium]